MSTGASGQGWLVLTFHFPKKAGSARMKIWRRLQTIGSLAIKNSVYLLPALDQTREDFSWLAKELKGFGADVALFEAKVLDGFDDQELRVRFNQQRDAGYQEVLDDVDSLSAGISGDLGGANNIEGLRKTINRIRKKFTDTESVDFFGAALGKDAEKQLRKIEAIIDRKSHTKGDVHSIDPVPREELVNRTWVTRRRVGIDRIACAWLIRRWIDADAKFKFVADHSYQPEADELRFDMFEGEFTHIDDLCTFEVLAQTISSEEPAIRVIAEIVHDIDLKEQKFGRPEVHGISAVISGIIKDVEDDDTRLSRGGLLFDGLYESLKAPGQ